MTTEAQVDPRETWRALTPARRRVLLAARAGGWVAPYGGGQWRVVDRLVADGLLVDITPGDKHVHRFGLTTAGARAVSFGPPHREDRDPP